MTKLGSTLRKAWKPRFIMNSKQLNVQFDSHEVSIIIHPVTSTTTAQPQKCCTSCFPLSLSLDLSMCVYISLLLNVHGTWLLSYVWIKNTMFIVVDFIPHVTYLRACLYIYMSSWWKENPAPAGFQYVIVIFFFFSFSFFTIKKKKNPQRSCYSIYVGSELRSLSMGSGNSNINLLCDISMHWHK